MKTFLCSLAAAIIAALPLSGADPAKPDNTPAPTLKAGTLTFSAPAGWRKKDKPRMMSAGGFTSSTKDGEAGIDVDFFHFGAGSGGDIDSNVARWRSQFAPEKDGSPVKLVRKEVAYGANKVTLVEAKGTFLSGGPMSPQKTPLPGYALLGAIIEHADGNVFVKLTGPEKDVAAAKEAFEAIVGSAFPGIKQAPPAAGK